MRRLHTLEATVPGLAHALDGASPSLAQNSPPSLVPQNNNSATACLEPHKAIAILLDQCDNNIFAYLKFARSLDSYFPAHGSLSSDQVQAVRALSPCTDDEITKWLEQARKLSNHSEQPKYLRGNPLQKPSFAYHSPSGDVQEVLHAPSDGTSVCAPPNVVQIEGSYQSTLNASGVHPHQTLNRTNASHEATKAANRYWCTICEKRRSYKHHSAWKKHEKEHVETYVCMRGGPLEETEGGSKCILCGTSNPSEKHLDAHKIQKCGNRVQGSFICKRRGDLVKHLTECHDVREKTQGEAIADKWKETSKEQAWSCGFCGQLFHIFGDRLKHIEAHFERGQTLDEWDTTKVMEGLLLQPRMVDAWKTQLAFSLCLESSDLTWEKHVVKDLQHNLEVGPFSTKHAAALAKSAYELRQPKFLSDDKPPDFALVHGVSGPPTSDYDSIAERALDPYSMRYQPRTVANPSETLHSAMPALYEFPPATYDYPTFPLSEEDNGHAPRPLADQHTAFNGYQEHGNATTGSYNWQASKMLSDEPDDDDMFG